MGRREGEGREEGQRKEGGGSEGREEGEGEREEGGRRGGREERREGGEEGGRRGGREERGDAADVMADHTEIEVSMIVSGVCDPPGMWLTSDLLLRLKHERQGVSLSGPVGEFAKPFGLLSSSHLHHLVQGDCRRGKGMPLVVGHCKQGMGGGLTALAVTVVFLCVRLP